jgi:hypothetical protein
MATNILKADVTVVKMGLREIEGLMFENGDFGIAVPQICSIFQIERNQASKGIKALLGKGFQFDKVRTTLHPKAVNVLRLPDFEKLLFRLSLKGNTTAIEISEELIGLSLNQLFSDSFGIKFETEERQRWLKRRQLTKQSFWHLTDDIKAWLERNDKANSPNAKFYYSNALDAMNLGLFGKKSKQIKEELGIKSGELNRDYFSEAALNKVDKVQALAKVFIEDDIKPSDAITKAIETFKYSTGIYNA